MEVDFVVFCFRNPFKGQPWQNCQPWLAKLAPANPAVLGILATATTPGVVHKVLDEFSHYFCRIILTNNTLLIAYIN